jgi:hypothetical protein
MPLAKYINILTDALGLSEDMLQDYTGVITQAYPLRADIKTLQSFCDHYLNFVERHEKSDEKPHHRPFRFEVAAPFVLLQVVHYTSITAPSLDLKFAQNEVAFGFPVKCFDCKEKHLFHGGCNWQFQDFFMVYPFIYVDDAYSRLVGRDQYGWAKAAATIQQVMPNLDLHGSRILAKVSRGQEPFLEVSQTRPFLSGIGGLNNLLTAIPRSVGGFFDLVSLGTRAVAEIFSGANNAQDLVRSLPMLQQLSLHAGEFAPHVLTALGLGAQEKAAAAPVKVVTVKQVRDTQNPKNAVYTAVISSHLEVTNVHDGGALFDPLSMDVTGGIEIKVSRPPDDVKDLPDPVKELGLEPLAEDTTIDNVAAYRLRPILPIWSKVDIKYQSADKQYWRTKEFNWQTSDDPPVLERQGDRPDKPKLDPVPHYNYKRGSGGVLELKGPFKYSPFAARLITLPAKQKILQELVEKLNNDYFTFTADHSWVWLLIANLSFRTYKDTRLVFAVPCTVKEKQSGKGYSALFTAYQFAKEDWGYISENEVFGRFTLSASFDNPPSRWMNFDDAGPGLLTLNSRIFVEKKENKKKIEQNKEVLSVTWGVNAYHAKVDDHIEKHQMGSYVKPGDSSKFLLISLKQTIHPIEQDKAAYQELVGVQATLTLRSRDSVKREAVKMTLNNYPLLPIVEKLGLKLEGLGPDYYKLAPINDEPNVLRVEGELATRGVSDAHAGITLASRVGTGNWVRGLDADAWQKLCS